MSAIEKSPMAHFVDVVKEVSVLLNTKERTVLKISKLFEEELASRKLAVGYDFVQTFVKDGETEVIDDMLAGKISKGIIKTAHFPGNGLPVYRSYEWTCTLSDLKDEALMIGRSLAPLTAARKAAENEFHDFFNNAPIAMHWLGSDGRVMWANKTEMEHLGYTPEEYIGQPIMKFCPDEEELVMQIFQQLGSGNTIRDVPVRFRTKCGKIRNLLIDSNVKYKRDGSFHHTRCFIRDDTGRRIHEAKLILKAKMEERRIMHAKNTHDIRNPLNGVMGYCSLLASTELNDDQKEFVDTINSAAQGVLSIVNLMLEEKPNELPDEFSIRSCVDSAVEVVAVKAQEKGLRIGVAVDAAVPLRVICVPRKLRQIVINFVANAIKFTNEGHVVVTISIEENPKETKKGDEVDEPKVKKVAEEATDKKKESKSKTAAAEATAEQNTITTEGLSFYRENILNVDKLPLESCEIRKMIIEVRDTGIGMTPDQSAKLFKPWSQVEGTKEKHGGSGLGLYASMVFAGEMGGKCWVESKKGNGSSFFASFDVGIKTTHSKHISNQPSSSASSASASASASNTMTGSSFGSSNFTSKLSDVFHWAKDLHVAVCQRWEFDAKSVCQTLEGCGVKVTRCTDNKALLKTLKENDGLPGFNLIITEVAEHSDLAKAIKSIKGYKNVPIILTADISSKFNEKQLPQGLRVSLIRRPMRVSRLLKCMESLLLIDHSASPGTKKRLAIDLLSPSFSDVSSLQVLVVDDMKLNRKLMKRLLAKVGVRSIDEAESGEHALRMVTAKGINYYSVLLVDAHMPGMNGFETAYQISSLGFNGRVMAVSGSDREELMQEFKEWEKKACFDVFLRKPVNTKQLRTILSTRSSSSARISLPIPQVP